MNPNHPSLIGRASAFVADRKPHPPMTEPTQRRVGLIALADGVRANFERNSVAANVTTVGWRQRPIILNQGPGRANRVSFYPGREPGGTSGAAGKLSRDHMPTQIGPRTIATFEMICTCSVWAVDRTDAMNEEKNLTAFFDLFEATVEALHTAVDPLTGTPVGVANILWEGEPRWTKPPTEQPFGLEILFEFVQLVPLRVRTPQRTTPQFVVTPEIT